MRATFVIVLSVFFVALGVQAENVSVAVAEVDTATAEAPRPTVEALGFLFQPREFLSEEDGTEECPEGDSDSDNAPIICNCLCRGGESHLQSR